jgi:hypothetical protein
MSRGTSDLATERFERLLELIDDPRPVVKEAVLRCLTRIEFDKTPYAKATLKAQPHHPLHSIAYGLFVRWLASDDLMSLIHCRGGWRGQRTKTSPHSCDAWRYLACRASPRRAQRNNKGFWTLHSQC